MRLRNPALDGLRGVAVLAVVVFHAGGTWLPGGWLGVDVFFVLSGFLITSLVINEWARDRRCDLRRFWSRRARRLLPATVVLLAALAGVAALDDRALKYRTLRADTFASLASVVNWRFAHEGEAYFDRFAATVAAPPPLEPLGRGAVLPVVAVAARAAAAPAGSVDRVGRDHRARARVGGRDGPARVRYRARTSAPTRTRTGCCSVPRRRSSAARVDVRGRAVAASGYLGAAAVVAGFCVFQGNERLAFRGGIFAVGVATVLVVLAVNAADAAGHSSTRCRVRRCACSACCRSASTCGTGRCCTSSTPNPSSSRSG